MKIHEDTFAERLERAMRNAGISQAQLAQAIGISQPSIWKLVTGKTSTSRRIVDIANYLGVSVDWLANGGDNEKPIPSSVVAVQTKQNDPETFRVEVLDIEASAGPGTIISTDFVESIKAVEYAANQARQLFGNREPDVVKVITVRGDSMSGTIEPGDYIFVDISANYFDSDGLYVFCYGQTIHIKRLQMVKDKLLVLSDNKLYATWTIDKSDESEFKIIAKVLLRQSAEFKRFA